MLLVLCALISACVVGQTNCLRCLEDSGCVFCLDNNMCYPSNSSEAGNCSSKETERTDRCVRELGGDANKSVRYAIGFSVLGVALIVDITVRICARRAASKDEYSHL